MTERIMQQSGNVSQVVGSICGLGNVQLQNIDSRNCSEQKVEGIAQELGAQGEVWPKKMWREVPQTPPPQGVNPKDLIGVKKPPMAFIPPSFKVHLAMAFKNGADKYKPYNWRGEKIQSMIYLDAMMRHIDAFLDGEEYAEDSKVHHLAHAAACCGILLDAIETGNLIDNRPPKGKTAELIKRFTTS